MYRVELIVINKDGVRDPEGETLKRYVLDPEVPNRISSARVGKFIELLVDASSKEEAERLVAKLAEEKRLYNPIVHKIRVRAERLEDGSS
ncbi:phosphoribosylformylglycinamidine synthase PurS protein [Metallosphaera tengchongensis]|uniref:Phosphoribosylformylglycinamidine synthase subunit PurS n=1 Tax=Metallosphaera tengchongensis TaxID=1532350 RepID=A0A6N0NW80_9CREN|nr:phosphoribosylformylglycinamidine synthase subunit PurS [Metallosphaera tengchongensis]QKQ99617.1 phosphoribosylformylglycinamidine synthase PurS protein [Metallosphaera tengchongensis]